MTTPTTERPTLPGCIASVSCHGGKHANHCPSAFAAGTRARVCEFATLPHESRYRVERVETAAGDCLEVVGVSGRADQHRTFLGRFEMVAGEQAVRHAATLAADDITNELLCSGAIGHPCEHCSVGYSDLETLAEHLRNRECFEDLEFCERCGERRATVPHPVTGNRLTCVECAKAAGVTDAVVTEADVAAAREELAAKAAPQDVVRHLVEITDPADRRGVPVAALGSPAIAPLELAPVDAEKERRHDATNLCIGNGVTGRACFVRWSDCDGMWIVEDGRREDAGEVRTLIGFEVRASAIAWAVAHVEAA